MELTHLDKRQNPKMVDVSAKDSTHREAIARGKITMNYEAFCAIKEQKVKKVQYCKQQSLQQLWVRNAQVS